MRRSSIFITVLAIITLYSATAFAAPKIPRQAQAYQRTLIRIAQSVWGLNAPVATMAAQIHQESAWRSNARSKYAEGLAQFTPPTTKWISKIYPKQLGSAAPYSPGWAMRALAIYDDYLFKRIKPNTIPACDRWAMTLASYNGGLGWLKRDRRICASVRGCNSSRWWGHVEKYTNRAGWARRENRGYPRRILKTLESVYLSAGWPGTRTCI